MALFLSGSCCFVSPRLSIFHYPPIPHAHFTLSSTSSSPDVLSVRIGLFVLITHACTVFVYFIEKDLYDRGYPDLQEKYISVGERVVLALIFLAVPLIVYDQFRAADEAQNAIILRSVREHGHVIAAARGPVLSRAEKPPLPRLPGELARVGDDFTDRLCCGKCYDNGPAYDSRF